MHFTLIASLIIIGLLAGMLSGFLGVGGGVIMIPLMLILLGMNQHEAQGTSLAVLAVPVTLHLSCIWQSDKLEICGVNSGIFCRRRVDRFEICSIRTSKYFEEDICICVVSGCC